MSRHNYNLKIGRLPPEQLVFKVLPPLEITPASVDLRSKLPAPYDQGQLGSCTANALVGAFQYDDSAFMGSRLFLYYNERVLENSIPDDAGAYLSDGIIALKKYGICSEAEYPYKITLFAKAPSPQCYKDALLHKAITVANIPQTAAGMKASLAAGFPFVIGFEVYSSFESDVVAATGVVPMPGPREPLLGGHAVLVCGYDDSKQRWIVRNSWGTRWGDRGYFYIPYAYFLNPRMASDLWNITAVTKVAPPPAPAPKPTPKPVPRPVPRKINELAKAAIRSVH